MSLLWMSRRGSAGWLLACFLGCLCPVPRCSFVIRRVVRASSTDALFLCEAPPCVQTVEFRRIDLDVKFGRERVVVVGVVIQLFFWSHAETGLYYFNYYCSCCGF